MRIQVAGRHMDVGAALKTRITTELKAGVAKYFNRATDAMVTVSKAAGPGVEVDCAVHLPSGISLQAQSHGEDAHSAFGAALTKLEKRVRRYKRRLKNHHASNKSPLPAETAAAYVLAPAQEENQPGAAIGANAWPSQSGPLVIAETTLTLRTMAVSAAVTQLDLSEAPALLFRNAAHGGLNLVYRRCDGNIGWIDPGRSQTSPG